jgi:transcriptional regulator with XRE-family HTH domain
VANVQELYSRSLLSAIRYELPTEVTARVGENVRALRREAGLSQEEVGIRAAFHRTQLGKVEHGDRMCRGDTLLKLAAALSVPVAALFEGIEWIPAERAKRAGEADKPGMFVVARSSRPS